MRIREIALALAVATVVFAVSAATALAAAPVWQNCAEATERGLLENSKCTTKGSKKAFEWLETNTTAEAVTSLGKIKLTDTSTGVAVECMSSTTGTVGSKENASLDEVKEAVATECKTVKGTCAEPKAEAVNLPWKTELTEPTEGEVRDKIKAATKAPGWKVTCGKVTTDTCEGETTEKIINNEAEGAVESEFEAKSEKTTCSIGGKGTGETTGSSKIKASEKGVGAIRAVKAGNFTVTSTATKALKKGEKAEIKITNIAKKEAEVKEIIVLKFFPEDWEDEAAEINFCVGKYKEKESCKFKVTYVGNELSVYTVFAKDENMRVANTSLLGE